MAGAVDDVAWAGAVRRARADIARATEPEALRAALARLPGVIDSSLGDPMTPPPVAAPRVDLEVQVDDTTRRLALWLSPEAPWTEARVASVETLAALFEARCAAISDRSADHSGLMRQLAGLGTWSWDLETKRIEWSDEVFRMFGLDRRTFGGTYDEIRPRIHPDDRERWADSVRRCVEQGQVHDLEFRTRWTDGTERVVTALGDCERDPAGRPRRMLGVVRDVTERRQADHALRVSAERYRSLMQQTSEGFYLFEFTEPVPVDLPAEAQVDWFYRHGHLVECNDAFARMYGLERGEDLRGRPLRDFHGGDDNPDNRAFLRSCVENDFRVNGVISEEVDASGQPIWVSNDILGVVEGGYLIRVWGTQTDITEIRKAEQERERLLHQLAQAQKLESLGRLAGGVAHDLNNLLTPIIGYTELLEQEVPRSVGVHDMLAECAGAAERARDLVKRLLAFGRRQPVHTRPVDLGEVVAGLEPLLRRTTPVNIEVKVTRAPIEPVPADVVQVEQVLMNLVANATDAMAEGGTLSIATQMEVFDEQGPPQGAEIGAGRYATLAVTDTGQGMDAETRRHVFEPFFTTKGSEGTGLGLATVHGVVRQHGGVVLVDSEPQKGSTFKVFFPAVGAHVAPAAPDPEPSLDLSGAERVLLVEDDAAVRHLTTTLLARLGYAVTAATSAEDALAEVDRGLEPDLLLTDVALPKMNGRELQEALGARLPGLKTLFTSGYTDTAIEIEKLQCGAHYLAKPFTFRGLSEKLRAVLDAAPAR